MNALTLPRITFLLLALTQSLPGAAQMMIRAGGEDTVLVRELGVVAGASPEGDGIELLAVLPEVERDVVLEEGDLVMMIDGVRVRDVSALKKAYESAATGKTVKLAFKRKDQRFLASFEKSDGESMPGGVRMMRVGGPGSDLDDVQPLQEFGGILGESNGAITVAMTMPMGSSLEEGDQIESINASSVDSLGDFRDVYKSLEIGDEITLVVLRDEERVTLKKAKAEPSGAIRVRREH